MISWWILRRLRKNTRHRDEVNNHPPRAHRCAPAEHGESKPVDATAVSSRPDGRHPQGTNALRFPMVPPHGPAWKSVAAVWALFAASDGSCLWSLSGLADGFQRGSQPAKPLPKFAIAPPPPAILEPVRIFDAIAGFGVSVSPNGEHVAYITQEGLWVHDLDRGTVSSP